MSKFWNSITVRSAQSIVSFHRLLCFRPLFMKLLIHSLTVLGFVVSSVDVFCARYQRYSNC